MDDHAWVDLTLGAVVLVSVLVGLFRGLVFEMMSLAGWLVAYFVSGWAAPRIAPHIPIGAAGGALNHSAALVLAFVAALVVWTLLAKLVKLVVSATPLTWPDRLLGAVFGLIRGGVLLMMVATVVALTPAAQSPLWQSSLVARWLMVAVQGVKPLLPSALAQWLPA